MTVEHGSLNSDTLLSAYFQGIFPMAHADGELYWHDPDPRAIFKLDELKPNARTQRFFRNKGYGTTVNTRFEEVIRACANREECWITVEMITAYIELHQRGFALSVETWELGELIGGIYGVRIGKVFFGESMFSRRPNASKAAFYRLAEFLRSENYVVFDTQYMNEHTQMLGAVEIPRDDFRILLEEALST